MALRRNAAFWATVLMLLAVVVTFWYVALVLPADRSTVTLASSDLYQEHYPVAKYGGEMLAQGRIPLWNPYQLNGLPFLAVPHSRIFYPPNWLYLWPQTGIAIEVDLVFRWLFAGIGLWLFVRVWGMGHLAGFAAATSFMLSRWLVDALIWPGIVDCAAWLPWTLLLIECAFRGRRWAPSGLALALGLQFTNGATEFILYNGYACALYTALRLVAYARREGTPRALGRLGWLACAVVVGIGLGAVQTLPTLELISQSSRFQGESGIEFARGGVFAGHYALAKFWKSMWSGEGWAALGLLPLLGAICFPRTREDRFLWWFALAIVVYTTLLIFEGTVFEWYQSTSVGGLFRRPTKFFYQYNLALGIFAACAITHLHALERAGRLRLYENWRVLAGSAIGLIWVVWMLMAEGIQPVALVSVALLVAFVLIQRPRARQVLLVALCAAQVVDLFLVPRNDSMRPFMQEDRFERRTDLLNELAARANGQQLYTSPRFIFDPATAPKQGLLRRARFAIDYEPLATGRQRDFFLEASMEPPVTEPFSGGYLIGPRTRWGLLDLAGVRFYLAPPREAAFDELRRFAEDPHRTGVRLRREFRLDVIERTQALPRAYFVPNARSMSDPKRLLDRLAAPDFRPQQLVLIESDPTQTTEPLRPVGGASVEIEASDPESVRLRVESNQPGYVVLGDTWYPGWTATVNDRETPIHRADFLFRAVEVPAGRSSVLFRYEPESFRVGAWISALSALIIAIAAAWSCLPRSRSIRRLSSDIAADRV
ncbi:MAG: YfhO family protein [bacterium]|nr:YfhO family protein [bacterium]